MSCNLTTVPAPHLDHTCVELVTISFHDLGDPEEKKQYMLECFRKGRHLITLASPDLRPGPMAKWLIQQGAPRNTDVLVGSALSLPEQNITRSNLSRLVGREFPWLSVTVVINPGAPSLNQDHRLWRQWRNRKKPKQSRRRK